MIEAALELTGGGIQGKDLRPVIGLLHEMMANKLELLEEVPETLSQLAPLYPLMLVTKGDLFEQSIKIKNSGLSDYFQFIEVVADKTPEDYRRLFRKYQFDPRRVVMVGNSLRSDIQPVLKLGGKAIYIPYATTWAHEHVDPSEILPGLIEIERFGQILESIRKLEEKTTS
jgi:putative hydrolase of the HAD superfamily